MNCCKYGDCSLPYDWKIKLQPKKVLYHLVQFVQFALKKAEKLSKSDAVNNSDVINNSDVVNNSEVVNKSDTVNNSDVVKNSDVVNNSDVIKRDEEKLLTNRKKSFGYLMVLNCYKAFFHVSARESRTNLS
jgi:hypothetical protein